MVLMVQQHLGIWLLDRQTHAAAVARGWAYVNMTGSLAAPLFILLAGVGAGLGALRPTHAVRRGLFLVLLGMLLNVLVTSWFSWGSFYVLHLLGTWLLLSPLAQRSAQGAARTFLLVWAAVFLLGAVVGQSMLNTPVLLNNAALRDVSRPGGALRLALWEGHFPLFPWLMFAFCGLWAAPLVKRRDPRRLFQAALLCAVLAVLARSVAWWVRYAPWVRPWRSVCRVSFYPISSFAALGLLSLSFLALALFVRCEKGKLLGSRSWLVPMGRTSLSMLFFHILVFREGLERLGLRHRLSPVATLLIIVGLLVVWGWLARRWARGHYRYGLEWWLRRIGSS